MNTCEYFHMEAFTVPSFSLTDLKVLLLVQLYNKNDLTFNHF